ncbi:MAG: chorismate synthase [Candidatus Aerophobetes bacterium]|nr:chorismate synthase [Candidatus Aerophobetes bacterium]
MLRYLTAGESHGKVLALILEGIPAGLKLKARDINQELSRRQIGYGRGGRMRIEKDRVEILAGVRLGETLGSPIALMIKNLDWENWKEIMRTEESEASFKNIPLATTPRPGHADLSGVIKRNFKDARNVLERASARETAVRVAVGAICKKFLQEFDLSLYSRVVQIGKIKDKGNWHSVVTNYPVIEKSPLRCLDKKAEGDMIALIDRTKEKGDTLGGIFEIIVTHLPIGLGDYIQWDLKLDARLARAMMSIQAIVGVEIGLGFAAAEQFGSEVQDEIFYDDEKKKFYRRTNNAGGIEGGMSNGEPIVLRAAMKPISTLRKPLCSVDLATKRKVKAMKERADICAVPAASIIGEAVAAFEIARAMREKFGGDSMEEVKRNYASYTEYLKNF